MRWLRAEVAALRDLRALEELAARMLEEGLYAVQEVPETEPAALVIASAAGTIRYAEPPPDYGNVIVLKPVTALLPVFAGLAEVYVDAGSFVPEGAPPGRMGGASPGLRGVLRETLTGYGASRSETIYI